jgi:hypothetical protein
MMLERAAEMLKVAAGNWRYANAIQTVSTAAREVPIVYAPNPAAPLADAVLRIFPGAKISLATQTDDEEGWSRPLLEVETGIDDSQKLNDLEQKFYEEVESHETLTAALKSMTVLFL